MNLLTNKIISLTAGQIQELAEIFEEENLSEGSFRIDNINILHSGEIQVFYTDDGTPKVKDISIYD